MASLKEVLQKLESQSNVVANVDFTTGSTVLMDSLLSRKRRYVRDADENEDMIASISMGEPISRIVEIPPSTKSIDRDEIIHFLHAAAKLNEICKSSEIEQIIRNSLAILDDKLLNIEFLNESRDQNDREIDALTIQNTETNSNLLENYEDLRDEEQEIERLKQEIEEKKAHNRMLVKRKTDYIRIGQDIKEMSLQRSSNPELSNENEEIKRNIDKLEQDKEELNQRIAGYDAFLEEDKLTVAGNSQKPSTSKELFVGVSARIDNLTKSPAQDDSRSNVKGLISKFKSIDAELIEILTKFEAIELNEKKIEKAKSVYYQLLTFVNNRTINPDKLNVDFDKFNEIFPHNTNTTVPQLPLSKESVKLTAILLKLYTEGDMTLQNLAAYMEDFAKEHGLTKEPTNTAIYSLVAANLVVIDRTHKDSLVKLKLTL